ncbi:MAG: sigma-70 family RNA polymerase sigma factor [Thiohalocapsa sp.]|nr:sigma-70 family RNA polymerase sigma factor [Thiohalocapsa sp.]
MSRYTFGRTELNRLYRYCFALTDDESAAFDLLQDGLERFLRAGVDAPAHPMAFLRSIIRNRFIDGLREGATRRVAGHDSAVDVDDLPGAECSLDGIVIAHQELEWIWRELDPLERELLTLWAAEGMTIREIAAALDIAEGTIAARIHRLRKRLTRERDTRNAAGNAA